MFFASTRVHGFLQPYEVREEELVLVVRAQETILYEQEENLRH